MDDTLPFHETVRARRTVRGFVDKPVPRPVIEAVLADAQLTPSNCNTQPWLVHIVSGEARIRLSDALLKAHEDNRYSPDFSFAVDDFTGCYAERSRDQGRRYHESLGIAREDYDERTVAARRNLTFFGAAHAAFLFMPSVGDNVRSAADIGMYGQTFLLALAARGLGGAPQTMLGFFADTVRETLGIAPEHKLLFGISFGYVDEQSVGARFRMERAHLDDTAFFHDDARTFEPAVLA